MKKLFLILLMVTLAIVLILGGCAKSAPSPTPTAPAQSPSPTKPAASPTPTVAKVPMPWDPGEWPIRRVRPEWGWPEVFVTNGMRTRYPDAVALASIIQNHLAIRTQAVEMAVGVKAVMGLVNGDFAINEIEQGLGNAIFLGVREFADTKPGLVRNWVMSSTGSQTGLVARTGSGIKTPADLKGKRVAASAAVPVFKIIAEAYALGYGLKLTDVNWVPYTATTELVPMMKENRIDAFSHIVRKGAPESTEMTTTGEGYVVGIDPDKLDAVEKAAGVYPRDSIPAGSHKGQDKELLTLAHYQNQQVRSDAPESLVYAVTRVFWENIAEYHAKGGAQAATYIDPKTAMNPDHIYTAGIHPGAIRYYKEIGVWTDAHEKANQAIEQQLQERLKQK